MRPRLIFVHIPKTAGSTFMNALEREYGAHYVWLFPGGPGVDIDDFVTWAPARLADVHAVAGHYPVGLAHLLPGESRYVTIFRDPVERIVSFYSYVQTYSQLGDDVFGLRVGMSLPDWLSESAYGSNHQTQMIGGDLEHPEPADEHTLAHAIERLDGGVFAAFGLQERFDESLLHIARVFGWKRPRYTSANVNPQRPHAATIDAATRALIEEHNRLDLALYEHARRRFDEIMRADPIAPRRLRRLQKGARPLVR